MWPGFKNTDEIPVYVVGEKCEKKKKGTWMVTEVRKHLHKVPDTAAKQSRGPEEGSDLFGLVDHWGL